MPALFMSGWKFGRRRHRRRCRAGAPPLPPNRPPSLRLKSRQSSSRSGGPSLRPAVATIVGLPRPSAPAVVRPAPARQAAPPARSAQVGRAAIGRAAAQGHAVNGGSGRLWSHWVRMIGARARIVPVRRRVSSDSAQAQARVAGAVHARAPSSAQQLAQRRCPVARADEDARHAHAVVAARTSRCDGARPLAASRRSSLLNTRICGTSPAPISCQHALDFAHLLGEVGTGRVDHVQQQVGIGRLLQRGLEGLDQLCGRSRMKPTVSDKATPSAATLVEVELARGGVERGEQLVGRVGLGLDQRVEQRRLAGVGVADQRDAEGAACARARGAACCAAS